mgnify:CR=1 FL=1
MSLNPLIYSRLQAGQKVLHAAGTSGNRLDRTRFAPVEGLHRGAYVLSDPDDGRPELILMSSGSEVHTVLEAAGRLEKAGKRVRVVSMPSWELFLDQPPAYRKEVLPPDVPLRIAVEPGASQGWHRFIGDRGRVIGLDHFGASAPAPVLYEEFGITAERVEQEALQMLEEGGA